MNDTINLDLNLPIIGGTLIAFFEYKEAKVEEDFFKQFPHITDIDGNTNWEGFYEFFEFSENAKRNKSKYTFSEWKIKFTIGSRDRRYNHGDTTVYGSQLKNSYRRTFEKFNSAFEEALKKMKIVAKQNFSGTYKKKIDGIKDPTFEVVGENGKVYTNIWISSGTTSFAHEIDIETAEKIIEQLKDIPEKAQGLMNSLEELTS